MCADSLVSDFEGRYLTALLRWADGNVTRAARKAKIDRIHLHRLVTRHDLEATRTFK